MTSTRFDRRNTAALEPLEAIDASARVGAEVKSDLRLFEAAVSIIQDALARPPFVLQPFMVLWLHRRALEGISKFAGAIRVSEVRIEGSEHTPPPVEQLPKLLEEMCGYVNEHWRQSTPIHLSAYVMWRLNWIQPFFDGNGRVARMLSYIVMCIRAGAVLPGTPTIPQQIAENRTAYFEALDAADLAWGEGRLDLSMLEELLSRYLARQLTGFYEAATKIGT